MSNPAVDPVRQAQALSRRAWIQGTLAAALGIGALDAALLQQKKSFFTGGFLAATHAASVLDAIGFLAGSFVVDAAIVGALAIALLVVTSRARLTRLSRLFLMVAGSMTPLVIWDFITYSLLTHLGDAFDLGLMFDLTGRRVGEVFAVASSHLAAPVTLISGAIATVAGLVWAVNRCGAASTRARAAVSRRLVAGAGGLLFVGLLTSTVASSSNDLIEDGLRRKPTGQLFTRLVARVTDFDRDGFGIGGRTSDPAPFNRAIFPYALDVPGNGMDENGVGGDLPSAEPRYDEAVASATSWPSTPDVIVFVLESFRADAVGRDIGGRPVTPVLDALARQGVSTSRAFSHNGYTTQSRFHLLTGSLAGLRRDGSIIDDFKAQGYQTAYFSAQDESFGGLALGVGFDRAEVNYDARRDVDRRYTTFTTAGSLAVSHAILRRRIEEFLAARDSSRPLFLYVNFHDTHFPYHHRDIEPILSNHPIGQAQIVPSRKDAVQAMYYNAAANVDRAVASTLAAVTRTIGRAPAVIVTADHGESLFDEGFLGHGYALNDVQTRIPLIVRGLPIEIGEPLGQSDLRAAVRSALSRGGSNGGLPRVFTDPAKVVFQYLGNIQRPRQIAHTSSEGRLVYDFRDRRVLLPDGRSVRPGDLSGEPARQFLQLIHAWERMMLAGAGRGSTQGE